MKISRRFFVRTSFFAGLSLAVSRLLGFFNVRSSFAETNVVLKEKKEDQCNMDARVVSVYAANAIDGNRASFPYVDSIDPGIVGEMLNKGLMELTEKRSAESAWKCIFDSYKDGDTIAIKPNFNDIHKEFRENLVASPAVLNAIIRGLIEVLKVPSKNIIIYDCSRIIPDSYRERIKYPVKFVEPYGSSFIRKIMYKTFGNPLPEADRAHEIKMSRDVIDGKGNTVKCYLPKVITTADHIINVPILKSHQFVIASGALKNHYGTVRFSDGKLLPKYLHPPVIHESIADINAHPVIREKTRLIVLDALFGRIKKKGGAPDKWYIFDDKDPGRLFLSHDPVALDSVSAFFVKKELKTRGDHHLSDEYLKIAAKRNIGVYEMPDKTEGFTDIDFRQYDI